MDNNGKREEVFVRREDFYTDPEREARIIAHMERVKREEASMKTGYIRVQGKNTRRDKEADMQTLTRILSDGVPRSVVEIMSVTTISEKLLRQYLKSDERFTRVGSGEKGDPWKFTMREQ
jgi:hypothetical protein